MGIETALIAGAVGSVGAAYMDSKSRSDATDSAMEQRKASQDFIQKQIDQARADIFKLFPEGQKARTQGLQAGLSLYQQSLPAMMNAFQGGNVAAQKQLLAGLPQMQNAILGNPVDYSGLQAVQLNQPAPLQMPNYQPPSIQGLTMNNQAPQIDPQTLAMLQQGGG